jgi:hypothetical protein
MVVGGPAGVAQTVVDQDEIDWNSGDVSQLSAFDKTVVYVG